MKKSINIVVICGSVRPGNVTRKAVQALENELKELGLASKVIDPAELELPLPGLADNNNIDVKKMKESVTSATAVVIATPEYHGSYSSVTKLIIDNLGFPSALSGKPVALLGVASGEIGAIKALEHLRSVCSHVGALVLPGPVSIATAHSHFDTAGRLNNDKIAGRIRNLATNLAAYIENHVCPAMALERIVREQSG
jgi:FMN reductase